MTELTPAVGLDLFFRFAALGQLLVLACHPSLRKVEGKQLALIFVGVCSAAYLLLSSPIPGLRYGELRGILLAFTDAYAYAVCLAALYLLKPDFKPGAWHPALKLALLCAALWHFYFFAIRLGDGWYHTFNHILATVVSLYLIYLCVIQFNDDLISRRRRWRVVIVIAASVYMLSLALVELEGGGLRQLEGFGAASAGLFFLISTAASCLIFYPRSERAPADSPAKTSDTPEHLVQLQRALLNAMDDGAYRQTGLSVGRLADSLGAKEYMLRQLINVYLGHDNFSSFLNGYRLREAREQLADPKLNSTPILTIALNLGYGSIGPFNRAFKAASGETPSEYRQRFQNRPA